MKKLALFLIAVMLGMMFLVACFAPKPAVVLKSDYLKLQDSIESIELENQRSLRSIRILRDSVVIMQDSIEGLLIRPMMTEDQFVQLYKFERLEKYYRICKKNPVQWKYYKGWSIRVFEHE